MTVIRQQFFRYAAVGLGLNATLYGAYLVLTQTLMGSRAAMTITYSAGVVLGFMLNRSITFRYRGRDVGALLRYVASYGIGYAINFATLWFFVDRMGVAHEIVQGGMVLTLPVVLFALQRYWVFSAHIRSRPILYPRSAP